MADDSSCAVLDAARRAATTADAPLLLAVSGGLDSMALLVATVRVARERVAAIATFDHGTGPAATASCALVVATASALGVPAVTGRLGLAASPRSGREAAWRAARHDFLRQAAMARGARVVTAHTEDDLVETVLMRVMRGSGARGLAAMLAPSPIVRPWLGLRRARLEAWARAEGVAWVDDPGNASREHLRNRVRHDLLPALRRADPAIDDRLLATAREAASWRAEVDALAVRALNPRVHESGELSVAPAELAGYDSGSLAVLWGALAARVGLSLDRRGTHRLASFIIDGRRTGSIPLSGGWCIEARPDAYVLRRVAVAAAEPALLPQRGTMRWGRFRFRVAEQGDGLAGDAGWSAALPADCGVQVRAWAAGDRLGAAGGRPRRRVKRYLAEAGVRGSERLGWPVVVSGEEGHDVVWIPGVRRSDAATERSGRPVRHYVCERIAP